MTTLQWHDICTDTGYMEKYDVKSGNVAILPQGEFVELASVIEVVDASIHNIVWNLNNHTDKDIEVLTNEFAPKENETMIVAEQSTNTNSRLATFKPHKEMGYFNTAFIALLTLFIYPILQISTSAWSLVSEIGFFKEFFKLIGTIIRS